MGVIGHCVWGDYNMVEIFRSNKEQIKGGERYLI